MGTTGISGLLYGLYGLSVYLLSPLDPPNNLNHRGEAEDPRSHRQVIFNAKSDINNQAA